MNKRRLVTRKQAEKLKELGFKEKVCHYQMSDLSIGISYPRDWNNEAVPYGLDNIVNYPYLSIPTVDEAIEWLINKLDKENFIAYTIVKKQHLVYKNIKMYFCIIKISSEFNSVYTKKRNSIYSTKKDLINTLIRALKTNKISLVEFYK